MIDSDHENSTLKRFHPDKEVINLEHRREVDRGFTAAETYAETENLERPFLLGRALEGEGSEPF